MTLKEKSIGKPLSKGYKHEDIAHTISCSTAKIGY